MRTCPKCGNELNDGARFCDHCGAAVPDALFALSAASRQIPSLLSAKAAEPRLPKHPQRKSLRRRP